MSTLQIRVDNTLKADADALFGELGMDTATAVRVFIKKALETGGFPFHVGRRRILRRGIFNKRRGVLEVY